MRKVIFFIIIPVITSCNNTNTKDIKSYYYPDNNAFDTIILTNLELNGFVDYAELF